METICDSLERVLAGLGTVDVPLGLERRVLEICTLISPDVDGEESR